jgi:hypothetical protein
MSKTLRHYEENKLISASPRYELPKSNKTRWLGYLFGDMYAKWCVRQMLNDTQKHFGQGDKK